MLSVSRGGRACLLAATALAGLATPALGQQTAPQSEAPPALGGTPVQDPASAPRPQGTPQTTDALPTAQTTTAEQPPEQDRPQSTADALTQDILVTGRRIGRGEALQNVPLAVTAFGEAQLQAANVRDLQNISFSVPNVSLPQGGAFAGIQNFTIRGLGLASSIPSTDPTVGVLVDGVYIGSTYGVLPDIFDLEGVEVLRGPQGVAFGRNVTGGAILLRNQAPTDKLEGKFRGYVESNGPEYGVAGAVNIPLSDVLSFRLTTQARKDEGFFRSSVSDSFGAAETLIIRPQLRFAPSSDLEVILRYERGEISGDGSIWQNTGVSSGFESASGEEGFTDLTWNQFTAETNIDVGFGDGRITNIFGYRDVDQSSLTDFDGRPQVLFHADVAFKQDQLSNELRYSGTPLPGLNLTVGAYYFEQDMRYVERRTLSNGAVVASLGGVQDQWTAAGFAAADVKLTGQLTLNLGVRYTKEYKEAQIATFSPTACNLAAFTCTYDFADDNSWDGWMPKLGLQWQPSGSLNVYGYYARGFRSGGYNFRNINRRVPPGPYDQETQDAFELGFKSDLFDRALRINGAVFRSEMKDLQRDINLPDPVAGNAQVIRNTADARIQGAELEVLARPVSNLVITGTLGYTDANYTRVVFDINNDGRIDRVDRDLKLVRVAPWTYGASATYEIDLGPSGGLSFRGQYSHRDASVANDPNVAFLTTEDILDANITYRTADGKFSLSAYARNLTNDVTWNGETLTPFGRLRALNEGRRFGLETNIRF